MSTTLLLVYLGFFHVCLGASYWGCVTAGIVGTAVWVATCYLFRGAYLSRFEYWIHLLVGLDIFLEGFSPLHEGYGFYYCAACFWMVFLSYHALGSVTYPAVQVQAETADPGLVG